jgi:hypothetical protein
MITSENLKNSEIIEDFDYLEADEAFPDFPDDENLDDLGFSDEPLEEAENTYMTMKDVDDLDKQVVDRYSQRAKKDLAPLQSLGQNITETADLNANAYEMLSEKLDDVQEEKEKALTFISKFKGFDEDTIKEIIKKQIKIFEDEIGKIFEKNYVDALEIQKNIISNAVEKVIEDKIVEAEKRLDVKLEACRLAEERLDKKEEELNRKQEEIHQKNDEFDQKVEEFYRQQESKQEEIEGMVASLVEQNNDLRDNLENEKKEKLQLKIVIEEQNKTIAAQTEQSEKLIITIKEENDQKAQILREKEELFDVIQKKDERRREEIREQNEEIKELRQVMIEKEEKMERNNSILTILIALTFIFWAVAGFFAVSELEGLLRKLINMFSWSSFVIGFGVIIFKFYKGMWK